MECTRCRGLMVEDHFIDLHGTGGLMWMRGWRCMNCGHVVDPLIEANRRLEAATLRAMAHEELGYEEEEVHLGAETITRYAV